MESIYSQKYCTHRFEDISLLPLANVLQVELDVLPLKSVGYESFADIGHLLPLARITLREKKTAFRWSNCFEAHHLTL